MSMSAAAFDPQRALETEAPPAPDLEAGGVFRLRQAAAILALTLFAALTMIAATASGFET